MFAKLYQNFIEEPWLACSRALTVHTLARKLRKRAARKAYAPEPNRVLYVAASARPYHTSGYVNRTHEVIRAMRAAGVDVRALTRPGYPWDRNDRNCDAEGDTTLVDDVPYHHVRRPAGHEWPALPFALRAAPVIADIARRERIAVIHAASNHVNALPALLAARMLGIPFHYEMRGLWELTRISRMPEYEKLQAYKQGLQLEQLVASHADKLFVISEQLGEYVRNHWGVPEERMALLPNCVDPERFVPAEAGNIEPDSLGYAGSLIGYEGLDTLIEAVAVLARAGRPATLTIIGDGEARAELEAQVQRLGLADRIRFLGRMSPEAAHERLSRCAVVCIPRKPFKVCEIVPPIKLVEALAMAKPVIVADLPVLRDEMGERPAGWFFKAGDAADLARVIETALGNKERLREMSLRAREYAATNRRWATFVEAAYGARGAEVVARVDDANNAERYTETERKTVQAG